MLLNLSRYRFCANTNIYIQRKIHWYLAFNINYDLIADDCSRLSNGAMPGIIVGAVTGGVCLIGAIGHLLFRKRHNRGRRVVLPNASSGASSSRRIVYSLSQLPKSHFHTWKSSGFQPFSSTAWAAVRIVSIADQLCGVYCDSSTLLCNNNLDLIRQSDSISIPAFPRNLYDVFAPIPT
jgi:hypothetical protein